MRFLLIDRESADLQLARLVIEARLPGSEVLEVPDAQALARELRRDFAAAVVSGDPGWADGYRVAAWIHREHPTRPVVLWLEAGERAAPPEGERLGMDAWIRKTSEGFLRLPELLAELVGTEPPAPTRATAPADREESELEHLAHVLSHDLQAPLDLLRRDAERLEAYFAQSPFDVSEPDVGRRARRLGESARRMQEMLDAITDLARIGSRGRPFEPVALAQTVEEALANLEPTVESTGAEVRCEPLPVVRADRAQMVQLFQNLLGNALKFRREVPPRVVVSGSEVPEGWTVTVTDNGIGIAAEHQARIFDMFKRLHTAEEIPGSGVGLAVARRIMQRHGGEISVASEPDRGSIFRLTFPTTSLVHKPGERHDEPLADDRRRIADRGPAGAGGDHP